MKASKKKKEEEEVLVLSDEDSSSFSTTLPIKVKGTNPRRLYLWPTHEDMERKPERPSFTFLDGRGKTKRKSEMFIYEKSPPGFAKIIKEMDDSSEIYPGV